ncbi:hypothetical protein KBX49_03305 [Liquorilactobacillus satsumensis]|uniref:cyclophilin-like fold protein n=1 Tax=Lactobacillaceae TaxID=33958 RepID=UPI0021C4B618|nr:cyclophilin-like fold protein [Liquorilactobacillus satsumensis]MCP9357004.1 hypothetical protein [Liquorilactobacillus satsumensis]MCP9370951.1 hypothetical protein [Liquorilactobacillus satsumensis]
MNEQKVKVTIGSDNYIIQLVGTKAAQDFTSFMPMTLKLNNFGKNEKISELPGKLDISDSPAGTDAKVGDVDMYAPWGNLAVFIRPIPYSQGLVNLGHIEKNGANWINYPVGTEVHFELT